MTLWIDGDSCPRQIITLAVQITAQRGVGLFIVADRPLRVGADSGVRMITVPHGSGGVDDRIFSESAANDIALTRDFGLGLRLLKKGVAVINDEGRIWTIAELEERRDDARTMEAMRVGGFRSSSRRWNGPDMAAFAAALRTLLPEELTES